MRRDSSKAIATDSEGHELRVNDNVKEVDGEVSTYFCLHREFYLFTRTYRAEKDAFSTLINHSMPSCIIVILSKIVVFSSPARVRWHLWPPKATSSRPQVLICPR